jgi:hypothetical protein
MDHALTLNDESFQYRQYGLIQEVAGFQQILAEGIRYRNVIRELGRSLANIIGPRRLIAEGARREEVDV